MNKAVCLAGLLGTITSAIAATPPDYFNGQPPQVPDNTALTKVAQWSTTSRYIVMFTNAKSSSSRVVKSTGKLTAKTGQTSVFGKSGFLANKAADLIQRHGGKVKQHLKSIGAISAELTPGQIKQLQNNPEVQLIEPDVKRTLQAGAPYGIGMVQADLLSDAQISNQKVCIIDTGYDISHEDLMSGANVTGEVSNTLTSPFDLGEWSTDTYGHGTHVAGTISALNNDVGIDGISPNGLLNLHIVKVIHKANYWEYFASDVIDAVNRCQVAGATVINMSLAGSTSSTAEQVALQSA